MMGRSRFHMVILIIASATTLTPSNATPTNYLQSKELLSFENNSPSITTPSWSNLCKDPHYLQRLLQEHHPYQKHLDLLRQHKALLTSLTCNEVEDDEGDDHQQQQQQPSRRADDDTMTQDLQLLKQVPEQPQVQNQVIFIQIPENELQDLIHEQVNRYLFPKTVVYIMPPEIRHVYKIRDLRKDRNSGILNSPTVNYLSKEYRNPKAQNKSGPNRIGTNIDTYSPSSNNNDDGDNNWRYPRKAQERYPLNTFGNHHHHQSKINSNFEIIPATYLGYTHYVE